MSHIEYEAKFLNIDKKATREKLQSIDAALIHKEFLQKRIAFRLPAGHEIPGGWIRIRREADKNTMSLKIVSGNKIHDQREIMLTIDNFETAEQFLVTLGCTQKSYQENKRELWRWHNTDITIDEWPFLEPFLEIEGVSEKKVKEVAKILGFDYSQALFGATDIVLQKKYGLPLDVINATPLIIFDMKNPFLKKISDTTRASDPRPTNK